MSRRRWIADQAWDDYAALVGDHAAHLARVLRAQVGQEFEVSAAGRVRLGRIEAISDERVEFALGADVQQPVMPQVNLLLAVFKFDRLEWAVEKATELGVTRIVPVIARRTDSHLAAAAAKRVERWRRIAREAAQQSRRAVPPEVSTPEKLKVAIGALAGLRIVLSEEEREASLRDVALQHFPAAEVWLAVGPEGGWTAEEGKLLADAGWISASMGPAILRAETAAIAALAILHAEMQ